MTSPVGDLVGVDAQTLRVSGKTVRAELREALQDATLTRTIDGAATLALSVHDPDRSLVRSKVLAERTSATVDRVVFELAQVNKSGSQVSVVFEDAVVADLRKATTLLSAKPGTTTIDAFARRLIARAPGAKLVAYGGQRNLAALAVGNSKDTTENYWEGLTRLAEERGWRCFVDRGVVYFGPDSWLATRVKAVSVREHTDGVEDVDWDADTGKKATRASFMANLTRWAAPPGTPVNVLDQGLGSGVWLVEEVTRSLFRLQGTVSLVRQQPVIPEPKPEPRDDGQPWTEKAAGASGAAVVGPVSAKGLAWPLSGALTSGFGQRGGRLHAGQDIGVPVGTPVRAVKDGTVTHAGAASGYGIAVYIDHGGGLLSRYGHLSKVHVRTGQQVDIGELIGESGNTGTSTGPHLHLEVRVGGRPVDPLSYLPAQR